MNVLIDVLQAEIQDLKLQIELMKKAEDRHMQLRNLYERLADHHARKHPDCILLK